MPTIKKAKTATKKVTYRAATPEDEHQLHSEIVLFMQKAIRPFITETIKRIELKNKVKYTQAMIDAKQADWKSRTQYL